MAGEKILVVDDEKVIHTFMKAVLERAGFSVTAALDAMQGPMVARQVHPDLVILDISMPGGSGFKVFDHLKKLPTTAATPVLVYSAVAKDEILKHIPEGAKVRILTKPASPDELVAAVRQLLGAA